MRTNIRWAITGALLLILLGSLQACGTDPTSVPEFDGDECVLIDGVLVCP